MNNAAPLEGEGLTLEQFAIRHREQFKMLHVDQILDY
jgi:hypothetical protein